MATEVASAYVSIGASTKGVGRAISKEFDAVEGKASNTSKSIGSRIGGAVSMAGKAAAGAVALIGGSVAALAIKGGIDRALGIENAQAKLKGLGHDAKSVEQIMTDALGAVRGTAFGLDAAATVAASAVAAGIKPGQDLERYLTLTADAATIAGVSMDEMGGIMNKVTANGKAMTENLYQLQDRGIPIMQWLADEYGVTAEELQKMVSSGQVDAETYRAAIEKNIGGAALESGATTQGAFANMGAALSRLGVTAIQPFYDKAAGVFGQITVIIDGLSERFAPFAAKITEALGGEVGETLDTFGDRALAAMDGMAAAFSNPGDLVAGIADAINGGINAIIAAAPGFLAEFIPKMVDGMVARATLILEAITEIVTSIITMLPTLLPVIIQGFVQFFTGMITALTTIIPLLVATITGLIPMIVQTLVTLIPILLEGALSLFTALVEAIPLIIPPLVEAVLGLLPLLIESVLGMVPMLLETALELFMSLITAVLEMLPMLIETVLTMLPMVIETLMGMLPKLIDSALKLFLGVVMGLLDMLPTLLKSIIGMLPSILRSLLNMLPGLIDGAFQLFTGIVDAIPKIIPELISAVFELLPEIVGTLLKMIPDLISAGVDMIGGLVKGLWNAAGSIGKALLDIAKNAIGGFLSFLGINSPSKLFMGFGINTGEGFVEGVEDMKRPATDAMQDMVSGIPSRVAIKGEMTDIAGLTGAVGAGGLNRSDLDYLADRIARLMGLESERGTSRAFATASSTADLFGRMG